MSARSYRPLLSPLMTVKRTILPRLLKHYRRMIWEVDLTAPRKPSEWAAAERLIVLGPDNVDASMTADLHAHLAAVGATGELEGVRNGDRLFVVVDETGFVAHSFIFFDTTKETRRQARILGESSDPPIVGLSYTAVPARGRGLYRRILNDMFRFLGAMGYRRAICEIEPKNVSSQKASEAARMRVCRNIDEWTITSWLVVQAITESGRSRCRIITI